jgi:hypothetical protein
MIYDTRVANLQTDLATLTSMSTEYQELTSRTGPASSKKTELQGKIQALKAQISDLASATSTYEKEFLDRKESLPPYSRTLQDLVLSGFFFSYLLLTLFMIFQIYRTTGLVVASTAAFILGIFGVILAELVRRYA